MKTSETQTALVQALMAAQRAFPPIPKTKEGQSGNRKFKYAPYEYIKELCDPILWENGLMVTQGAEGSLLVTRLDHISGEWRETRMPMNDVHPSDQAYGIEFSYRRRYSYQGILGIVTEEDVDGNSAKRGEKPKDVFEAGVTIKHAVRDGIGEDLSEDWKTYLRDMAAEIVVMVSDGKAIEAAQMIARDKLEADQRTYLENKMDSKTRSAIKKAEAEVRAAFGTTTREKVTQ